jgi:hypothetical protein
MNKNLSRYFADRVCIPLYTDMYILLSTPADSPIFMCSCVRAGNKRLDNLCTGWKLILVKFIIDTLFSCLFLVGDSCIHACSIVTSKNGTCQSNNKKEDDNGRLVSSDDSTFYTYKSDTSNARPPFSGSMI